MGQLCHCLSYAYIEGEDFIGPSPSTLTFTPGQSVVTFSVQM